MEKEEKYKYIRSHVFRSEVPEDLRIRFWECLGLKGEQDSQWWPESLLDVPVIKDRLLECIVELEPYYQRCYVYYAKREMTKNSMIQILRHLAKLAGKKLETSDRSRTSYGQKRIRMFRLSLDKEEQPEEKIFRVEFV